jgi:predicted peptidase
MMAEIILAATLTRGHFVEHAVTFDGTAHHYQVWVPSGYDPARRWPAILFLHGAGERGSDNRRQIDVGVGPALRSGKLDPPAIIVFPQCPLEGYWAGSDRRLAVAVLDDAETRYAIDRRRVTMTGMSMGGTGTWILAAENPKRFAAIAPVCAWVSAPPPFRVVENQPPWLSFDEVARRIGDMPVWIFHGGKDNVVPPRESREMISRLGTNAAYTEFPDANHNSWDPAYSGTTVIEWLTKQRLR